MRLVQLSVPVGKRTEVLTMLEAEEIDYVITDESGAGRYEAVVSFPLSVDDVERTVDQLDEVGIPEEAWTVVVDAKTVVSQRLERQTEAEPTHVLLPGRISREELRSVSQDLAPEHDERWSYRMMTAVSAVVATVGLLQNSAAVVVGSMVIAPLVGPAMSGSVGTVVNDRRLATRSVRLQVVGLVLAIASATVFGALVRFTGLVPPGIVITDVPEIQSRLSPNFLSLAVALGAGVAGAISLATGSSAALVGVMIAVALIPPAATVGIGIAWGEPLVSLGSGVLLLVNGVSINLAALVMFWALGYRPLRTADVDSAKATMRRRLRTLVFALVVLSVFLAGVTYLTYQTSKFEEETTGVVCNQLDEPPFRNLTLQRTSVRSVETTIAFDTAGIGHRTPIDVSVTVDRPIGSNYPTLAATLDRRLTNHTGYNVAVDVRFVDTDYSGAPENQSCPKDQQDSNGTTPKSETPLTVPDQPAEASVVSYTKSMVVASSTNVYPYRFTTSVETQMLRCGVTR